MNVSLMWWVGFVGVNDLAGLAGRAGMTTPRLVISSDVQLNAFATERNERTAVVCVTQGPMQVFDRDEVAGVVAQELAHLKHRHILIGSVAAAVATGISAIAKLAMFGGGDDDDGPNQIALPALSMPAPLAASITPMALSRSREFEADRGGAALLGDPRPLASALADLDATARRLPMNISPAQATAYIVNPLTGRQVSFAKLFLTRPPIEERIEQLMAIGRAPARGTAENER